MKYVPDFTNRIVGRTNVVVKFGLYWFLKGYKDMVCEKVQKNSDCWFNIV